MILLSLTVVLSSSFSMNRFIDVAAAAITPTTVTFTTNEATAWNDGIAVDGEGGSSKIPGINMQFYNISDTNGTIITEKLIHGHTQQSDSFYALTSYASNIASGWKGMGIQSSDGAEFRLKEFFYSNFGGSASITVKGYRDGNEVGSTSFTTDVLVNNYDSKTVILGSSFYNVDKVLLYSAGSSWHGINDIQINEPIITHATAPTIGTQPTDKTVNVGGSASLSVAASGSATLSYQWYSNSTNSNVGGSIIGGATSASYAAPTSSAGTTYYYAVVTNTDSSASGNQTATATSNAAKVTVNALTHAAAPTIGTQPTDKTVNVGGSASLSIAASGSATLSYQWYSNSTNSNVGGSLIGGATNASYSALTSSAGTAYYYVVVTNTDSSATGNQTATTTSNPVTVIVNALTNASTPTIDTEPTDKTVNVGDSANLSVAASGDATLSYQWYSNSTNSTVGGMPIGGATSASYSAPTSSAGTTYYYVVITNTDNSATGNQTASSTSDVATVTVNALTNASTPTIDTEPTDKTVNVGDSANLSVAASGDAMLSYQWYSNSTNSTVGGTSIGGATSASYSAPTSSAGTTYYYVVITNTDSAATGNQTATSTSDVATVTVNALTNASTPTIDTEPTDKTVNVGDSANLSVAASGDATLSYQWYSNSTNSTVGGTPIGGATSASYSAPTSSAGTTYYYVVITNTDSGATGNQTATSTSDVATVTVNALIAPDQPQNLVALGGNQKVTLNWSSSVGATYYDIFIADASGQYSDTPVATVTDTSTIVQNLNNGTAYYFIVKAGGAGGLSPGSNEASTTPATVATAPTNITAVAGDGQATVSFTAPADNGGSLVTGYQITVSPGNATVSGATSPITITGLTNGTSYSFTIKAINPAGESEASTVSNAVTPVTATNNSGGGGSSSPAVQPADSTTTRNGVEVWINGKVENIGTSITTVINNRSTTTIMVDQKMLEQRLADEGKFAVVTIPVSSQSDVIIGEINGQMLKTMEDYQAILEIKTDRATYRIPALLINSSVISAQLGTALAMQDIKIQITIATPTADVKNLVNNAVAKEGLTLVVPAIDFTVKGVYGDKTFEITKFNRYVQRSIAIPTGIDPSKITTGIVVEPDGTVRHVPTKVVQEDGDYFAQINSLTNSTYAIVWHPFEFSDVASHWSKNAVNDMGSRMIIEGDTQGLFNPNRDITRAEFAAVIVRGLGLRLENGAASFSDVSVSDWYSSAIHTAHAYELINGFEDGSFRPNDKITREQAMLIIAKAMTLTNLKAQLANEAAEQTLLPYKDAADAAEWAKNGIADSVLAGIVSGRTSTELAPKAFITRAEVAAIMQRLLQQSSLIQ